MDPKVRQSWEEFLNPEVTRPRLIAASIYIAGFEALKDSVVGRIRSFFWTGFEGSRQEVCKCLHQATAFRFTLARG